MFSRSITPQTGNARATLPSGAVVASATSWLVCEGNVYFPHSSLPQPPPFTPSSLTTYCPWKGHASYLNISPEGSSSSSGGGSTRPQKHRRGWYVAVLQALGADSRLYSDQDVVENAAWTYREPFDKAVAIKDYVAFGKSAWTWGRGGEGEKLKGY